MLQFVTNSAKEGVKAGYVFLPLFNIFAKAYTKAYKKALKSKAAFIDGLPKVITKKVPRSPKVLGFIKNRMAHMISGNRYEKVEPGRLRQQLVRIVKRKSMPPKKEYMELLERTNDVLINESPALRPHDRHSRPGGLVLLKNDIPTIIVPDLHARLDFFLSILYQRFNDGQDVLDKLAEGTLQVVCIGDAFHGEQRAMHRWILATDEFRNEFRKRRCMDQEMRESLGVMEMVLYLKMAFPDHFHFLKGNHENILNEHGNGNYPFRKFALEGPMVLDYLNRFYGLDFLSKFYYFEKQLPLLATGRNFMISHAEPMHFFSTTLVIDYRRNHDVIKGLTWTDNDQAEKGSVQKMINHYLAASQAKNLYYFGGHRPIEGSYHQRAEGKYVQFHNPSRFMIGLFRSRGEINLDRDIFEIPNLAPAILKKQKQFIPA